LDLARLVARGLALSLDLPESFFTDRMRDPVAQLLLLRYPPPATAAAAAAARRRVGCGEHTDCGFLTILAQDAVPGLEVLARGSRGAAALGSCCGDDDAAAERTPASASAVTEEGTWVSAPPLPAALLVNLGDLAEFWSGGIFRSTPHRVFIPEGAERQARHSVVMFCNCDFDAEVVPLKEGNAARYSSGGGVGGGAGGGSGEAAAAPVTAGRYIMEKLGLMYN
jgi:isopenicillin N synthase-like dioxygenase